MISVKLARRLRGAGLGWDPSDGDRFVIPDRNLDGRVFTISEMVVDVRSGPAGRFIAFNGTVEWALDAIMQREVVWLPSEEQLRNLLGEHFVSLAAVSEGFECAIDLEGERVVSTERTAADAYGMALLRWLERLNADA